MRPIWKMIESDEKLEDSSTAGLNLVKGDVNVTYTRYVNNHKRTTKNAQSKDKTIDDALEAGLTPGEK